MSRAFFRRPEFRLVLGYPTLTLFRQGAGPVASADIAVPSPAGALAPLAAAVLRERGRLTVVLPEAEVWRARVRLPAGAPLAGPRRAREAAAGGLAVRPEAVALALGPRDAAGLTPVAAVRRDILAETRAFLAGAGLGPAAITGAGDFPGFAAPPDLWSRWPSLRRLHARVGSFPVRPAAAAGLAGSAALALALVFRPGAPEPAAAPVAQEVAAVVAPAAGPAEPVVPPLRPAPRPENFVRPVVAEPAPNVRTALPSPSGAPRANLAPTVTMASRNVAVLPALPKPATVPPLQLAELTTARARLADTTPVPPFRRPEPAADPAPVAAATPAAVGPRPRSRPSAPEAASAAAAVPAPAAPSEPAVTSPRADAETGPGPRARPAVAVAAPAAAPEPAVQVAMAAPGQDVAALVATALATSIAPEVRTVAPVARPARAVPAPQPARVVQPTVVPKPAAQQARIQPARVQPAAPVRTAAPAQAAPKPAKVVRSEPAPKPARQRAAVSSRPSRNDMVLVGIFGTANDRHALLQLSSGKVKRVRAGDSVQGIQVAAVSADSVHLRGGGREATLRLPQ